MLNLDKIDTTGWTPEQIAELEELRREGAELAQKRALLEAQAEAERSDPRLILAREREAQDQEKKEQELREREVAGDRVYKDAKKKHGEHAVARISTWEGPIVLTMLGLQRIEEIERRRKHLSDDDFEALSKDALRGIVLYPDLPTFDAMVEKYPGLWGSITEAHTALAHAGAKVQAGKD